MNTFFKMNIKQKRALYYFLLVLFLADVGYSFMQHYSKPIDGDMATGIVPAEDVKPILKDPFALKALVKKEPYSNPNKFFSHWTFYAYFNSVPLWLQGIFNPIKSAYLSCALAKIIIQILFILILAVFVCGSFNMLKLNFMLAVALITPLLQTNGYRTYMGIIDASTTSTFFYAMPAVFILLYFLPIFFKYYLNKTLAYEKQIRFLWIPLGLVVCLSGPLNPGIALIISLMLFALVLYKVVFVKQENSQKKGVIKILKLVPFDYYFYLIPISLFSLYSLFLSKYNAIDYLFPMPLGELYARLPAGIVNQFFQKLGFPILFLVIAVNAFVIYFSFKTYDGKKILTVLKLIGIFSAVYILLLPLGGYRDYRPNVLRFDTILPISIALFFIFAHSTLFLLKNLNIKYIKYYTAFIIVILFLFINADKPNFSENQCEKQALEFLSTSNDSIVKLGTECKVMTWYLVDKPEDSEMVSRLLVKWKITESKVLFYNCP